MSRQAYQGLKLPNLNAAWRRRAACRDHNPDTFYPEPGPAGHAAATAAKKVCAACPVRMPCLREALSLPTSADYGIWGATTQNERNRIRRNAVRRAAA